MKKSKKSPRKSPQKTPQYWGFVHEVDECNQTLTTRAQRFARSYKSHPTEETVRAFIHDYISMSCHGEDVTDTIIRDNVFDYVKKVTKWKDDRINHVWDSAESAKGLCAIQ